mmetsp:Transcript_6739/g.10364  ORF Transcript_6739/g.10364 Transcript_6739/m.10364 type:complete len:568 (+) Transcript_6739:363-2066(+)
MDEELQNTCQTFRSFATAPPEKWRLSRLENGLRIFEEEEDPQRSTDERSPGCKGVGLICSRPEPIFRRVMDLEESRREWDLTFDHGSVIEVIDEHTDVIQVTFRRPCSPQDFCLKRHWRCEPDGSYVVVLSSAEHPECQHGGEGLRRGKLCGGWIIAPFSSSDAADIQTPPGAGAPRHQSQSQSSTACLVTSVVRLERKGWFEWLRAAGVASLPQRVVLAQVAGLRELCEHTSDLLQLEELEFGHLALNSVSERRLAEKSEEADNFFEATSEAEVSDDEGCASVLEPADLCVEPGAPAGEAETSGCTTLGGADGVPVTDSPIQCSGSLDKGMWPFEEGHTSTNCWCEPDGDYFRVRGANYLRDRKKVSAGKTFADLVAVDWFVDYQRIDDLCSRPTGTCQREILSGSPHAHERFVFAVNIQVPGSRHFSIVYYYVLNAPLDENSLFGRFVKGTDEFRNSRFKLIPHVALGPWVVQRAVGTKPLIVGRALKVAYHSKPNYLEVDIDIGSSTVANNVVRFVLGYVRTLVVDMCFLVEGKTDGELPERLLGTSRVAHLDMESAVAPPPVA